MATHSSILAGRIPRAEETGGLQAMSLKESDMTKVTYHTPHATIPNLNDQIMPSLGFWRAFHCFLDKFPHPRVFMAPQFFFFFLVKVKCT